MVPVERRILNRQIFIVGYLRFVESKHLQTALCSAVQRASTVARELRRRLSKSGTAVPLKNGS